jgi:flap endonuclease-1
VWAVGTEDMDALTFACPILLRKMTFASGTKPVIQQMDYNKAIQGLGLTHDQFVDLCILLGCDYCDSIKGIGPKTALKLIRDHGDIETILKNINREKYQVPSDWVPHEALEKESEEKEDDDKGEKQDGQEEEEIVPIYVQARKLFKEHEVNIDIDLKWTECQPGPLIDFLVGEMGFSQERVQSSIEKLQKALKSTAKPQMRMDAFFKPIPGKTKPADKAKAGDKRKAGKDAGGKAKKGGGFFGKKK